MKNLKLICTSCKKEYPLNRFYPRCDNCNEPLEIEKIVHGKIYKKDNLSQSVFERYIDFLPFTNINKNITLNEGFTPLVKSNRITSKLEIKNLYFKNETQNPTWSFKDRGTFTGILHAINLDYKKIGTVSTGNMAVSVSAYGKKAGIKTYILVKDDIPKEKLNPVAIYNPVLIKVEGDYGELYFKSLNIGKEKDIYFINSDVPLRVEGYKTIAYEICEQLNFKVPDFLIVPTSAGGNIRGIIKGFEEFEESGFIDRLPVFVCVQAEGCSPIYKAFIDNQIRISRFDNPDTIAKAIANPYPPSGNAVLRKLKETGGLCISVTDSEIVSAQKSIAGEGLFVQPASASSLAAVYQMKKNGIISKDSTAVCILTGTGLKYIKILEKYKFDILKCGIDQLKNLLK